MIDMNQTQLTGNLAADLGTAGAGETTVTRGRIIHTNSYKDRESGEWKKSEPFAFDFEVWGKRGETLAAKARKGTAVFIEGGWIPNHFEKEDGTKVFAVRLRVTRCQILAQPGDRAATEKLRTRRKSAGAAA